MMITNLFVIANVKQLRTQVVLEFYCLFFRISWDVGVLNSAIFNSFHSRVEFGMILEGLLNFGGGLNPSTPPPRYANVSRHFLAYANNVRSVGKGDLGPTDHRTNTDIQSLQVVAESTNRATADCSRQSLRTAACSEVDAFRRIYSKDNSKGYPLGDKASDDDDKLMIYNSEQVTRCIRNACCSSDGAIDNRG